MDNNNLFPVFDVPGELIEESETTDQYPISPMWDAKAGDFVTDGAMHPLYGNGNDAWVLWCTKAIMTQRWAHDGYSDNEGIEAEQAFREPDRQATESAFERTITEALLSDPLGRTTQVKDFEFTWQADSLWISCTVVNTNGNEENIRARLNG